MKTAWILLVLSLMTVSCASTQRGEAQTSKHYEYNPNQRR